MVKNNFIIQNMNSTDCDTDIFLGGKNLIFLASYILASKFASLEHNCHIFRTRPSHLCNSMCWPGGEESNYNTVTVLI